MAKGKGKNRTKRSKASAVSSPTHQVVAKAIANGAKLDRGNFEPTKVANPHGEVIVRGDVRRHTAVKRIAAFERLYNSNVIERAVFVCLEWYSERLAIADAGLFKCGLGSDSGGGGEPASHIPTTEAKIRAKSELEWARRHLPDDKPMLLVFDAVMVMDADFAEAGASAFPHLSVDRARRKASSLFKLAANYLLLGIGRDVIGEVDERVVEARMDKIRGKAA